MITAYISYSHIKFTFENDKEKKSFEKFINEKFSAKDISLEYDWRYKRGILSSSKSFYIESNSLLPIGFLAYLKLYLKKTNFEVNFVEYREFPKYDLKPLSDGVLRDYQIEAIETAVKYKTSILKLPVGSGKTLVSAYIGKVYPKATILYIYPSIDLVHQSYKEFVTKGKIKEEDISIFQGNNIKDEGRFILLSSDSYLKAAHRFPEVQVIMVDECFTYQTLVQTNRGMKKIGDIVTNKTNDLVLSFNQKENKFEYKLVINWLKKKTKEQLITIKSGYNIKFKCTSNHKIYIYDNFKIIQKEAKDLKLNDRIIVSKKEVQNTYKKTNNYALTKQQYQIILGKVLGNACLSKSKKNVKLKLIQDEDKLDYLKYCIECLDNLDYTKINEEKSKHNSNKKVYSVEFYNSIEFLELYNKIYINDTKTIKHIIEEIDEIALAFWFLDDGSIVENENSMSLSTHFFSKEDNELLIEYFKDKFNIEAKLTQDHEANRLYLVFDKQSSTILSNIIAKYTPKCMQYKLLEKDRGKFDFKIEKNSFCLREITSIEISENKKEKYVYDITVEDNHNFLIGRGNQKVLVSNCHYPNSTVQKIVHCCQKASIKVGLTATPDNPNPYTKMMMHSLFGPVSYSKEIKEMIDNGNLANLIVNIIEVPCDKMNVLGSWQDVYEVIKISNDEEREIYENDGYEIIKNSEGQTIARKFLEYGDESNAIVYNEVRNNIIKDIALKNKGVAILTSRIAHGQILKDLIGDRAVLINGSDDIATRKKVIEKFEEDDNIILIGSNILNTGVNIQNIKTLINASGGKSNVLAEQKIGRASRKSDTINKLHANVYDFNDSFHSMTKKQSKERIKTYESLNIPIVRK